MLAERYRMVGLLGRGGMGEVYRAEDLKLGQTVALKFLPRDVERDPDRLGRFLTEVRMSLRVTHPNVCRVYDIAEAGGRHFLSMEYVDGEDLASLLRRIGRLPEDKAVEIARQLCAGLQAAHDEGVLHRDLKPANVMIDGRGRAKITDFGLAGATEGISGAEARAGTPQYMAPEQTSGGTLSRQTDIYSLGLVLYELFTGKRALEARTLEELIQLQQSAPASPSAHVTGLDPVIERAILRCLDPVPANRPASAAALAAALPGGDPLAMAVAAGETPSPEMVAQAGGTGALRPAVAATCLVAILAGLAGIWISQARTSLFHYTPLPLSPIELRAAARSALAATGYPEPPVDTASGFGWSLEYADYVTEHDQSMNRWDAASTAVPPPAYFWYRESPVPLVPLNGINRTGSFDPPMTRPGMKFLRLSPEGHVWVFRAQPPDRATGDGPWPEPEWSRLFTLANFDIAEFTPAAPLWAPPSASDTQRAWVNPARGDVRIEAAAFRGRPVWFEIIPAWKPSSDGAAAPMSTTRFAGEIIASLLAVLVLAGSALLARRNFRLRRGDPRGATRLALLVAGLGTAGDLLSTSSSTSAFLGVWANNLASTAFGSAVVWLAYMALEPYVRRLWPDALIAWSRMLEGRLRDPMVGRHLLFGAIAGLAFSAIDFLPSAAARFGVPPPVPSPGGLDALGGVRHLVATYFNIVRASFAVPVLVLIFILLLRVIFRRPWIAYVVLLAGLAGLMVLTPVPWHLKAQVVLTVALAVVVLTRLGLFAMLVAVTFSSFSMLPMTLDPASWYFPYSVLTMLLFAAVAVCGFVICVGGQLTFRDPVLD